MILENGFPEKIRIQVGIDFSSKDGFVAQHILNGPQICSTLDEVRGKAMPESMGADVFFNPRGPGAIFDDIEYHHPT